MYRALAIIALLSSFVPCSAQRGGAHSVQNYASSLQPSNPELALNLAKEHKWIYFHLADLRKMKQTTINVTDPSTNKTTNYEGVSLDELVPDARMKYGFEVFREFWAFRDRRAISSTSLDLGSDVIVADAINGRPVAGENPFCFVAKIKEDGMIVVRNVADIRFIVAR